MPREQRKSTNPYIHTRNIEIQHVEVRPTIAQANTFPPSRLYEVEANDEDRTDQHFPPEDVAKMARESVADPSQTAAMVDNDNYSSSQDEDEKDALNVTRTLVSLDVNSDT